MKPYKIINTRMIFKEVEQRLASGQSPEVEGPFIYFPNGKPVIDEEWSAKQAGIIVNVLIILIEWVMGVLFYQLNGFYLSLNQAQS